MKRRSGHLEGSQKRVRRSFTEFVTYVMRTQYNAVGTDHLLALMHRAGFTKAERMDGRFYQPVLVGNREA